VLALQEIDVGCERSNCKDTGVEIAKALAMNYAFVCEFEEIKSSLRDARSQVELYDYSHSFTMQYLVARFSQRRLIFPLSNLSCREEASMETQSCQDGTSLM